MLSNAREIGIHMLNNSKFSVQDLFMNYAS